jgi:hypothetical protein
MVEPRFYTAMTAVQFCHDLPNYARVVELGYTGDLKFPAARIEGSNPSSRTRIRDRND